MEYHFQSIGKVIYDIYWRLLIWKSLGFITIGIISTNLCSKFKLAGDKQMYIYFMHTFIISMYLQCIHVSGSYHFSRNQMYIINIRACKRQVWNVHLVCVCTVDYDCWKAPQWNTSCSNAPSWECYTI